MLTRREIHRVMIAHYLKLSDEGVLTFSEACHLIRDIMTWRYLNKVA